MFLRPLKIHQLSGLVHWPTSWLCSVSTGLAQNNLSAAPVWLGRTWIHASSTCLSCKSIHHCAESCFNSLPQILTPRITMLLSTVCPASLFSPSLSLSFFHFHLVLCHCLPLSVLVPWTSPLDAFRCSLFFSFLSSSSYTHLRLLFPLLEVRAWSFHVNSFLDSKLWANRCSLCVVLCTAVDVYDTHTHILIQRHKMCHWVRWLCWTASWNVCVSNHYMQFHYILNRRISKPLSLWALLYLLHPFACPFMCAPCRLCRFLSVTVCVYGSLQT